MKHKKLVLLFITTIFFEKSIFAETKENLYQNKNKVLKKIENLTEQLKSSENEYKKISKALSILNNKIEIKNLTIKEHQKKSENLKKEINIKNEKIEILQKEKERLFQNYLKTTHEIYKLKCTHNIFIGFFFSKSFSNTYKKIIKLHNNIKINAILSKEINKITETITKIIEKKSNIIEENEKQIKILNAEIISLKNLLQTQNQYLEEKKNSTINLKESINKYNLESKKIEKAIKLIISKSEKLDKIGKEINKNNSYKKISTQTSKISIEKIPKVHNRKSKITLTKEFRDNKGKLLPPVDQGIIEYKFGVHQHNEFINIKVDNLGIQIKVNKKSDVRSIYEGVVIKILNVPGTGQIIIIEHGSFFSVYIGLTEILVKEGEYIIQNQKIGTIVPLNLNAYLQLQIWNNEQKLNPEKWLKKF